MVYRSWFQCPLNGLGISARYAFGRVILKVSDDTPVPERVYFEAEQWCKHHTNQRCASLEEANEHLRCVSDGQAEGFEESRY